MTVDPFSGAVPNPILRTESKGDFGLTGRIQSVEATGQSQDFSALLGNAIAGVSAQLREAEAVSMAGIKGTASTQDVVEQVMAAEQTLQASIAVRDKIVAAYLEISRMAI